MSVESYVSVRLWEARCVLSDADEEASEGRYGEARRLISEAETLLIKAKVVMS